MGNFFGIKRKSPVVTAQDRAILQLKQLRDKIRIYQKKVETDLSKNKELALKLFENGMKERAVIVLRRKKNMEEILSRTDKQLETLEQLVSDIEYTQIEVSVVEGLKVGTEAMKQLNNLMNIEDIQQMMEDNEEAAEKQREISNILQSSSERYDEDELLKELETYTGVDSKQADSKKTSDKQADENLDQIIDKLPSVPTLTPEVPASPLTTETKEDKLQNIPEPKQLELAQ